MKPGRATIQQIETKLSKLLRETDTERERKREIDG